MSDQKLTKAKFTDSEGVLLLPANFDQQVSKLEKDLKSCTLSIERFRELLDLYKAAITYYTNRNEKRKNEFLSKYKCILENPYATQLMKSRAPRSVCTARFFLRELDKKKSSIRAQNVAKRKQSKEIREEEEKAKADNVVEQIKVQLVEDTKILKTDLERQEEEFQKRFISRKGAVFGTLPTNIV